MLRIRFYSDDSYSSCGKKLFHAVTAGAAIAMERANIRQELLRAEKLSGKGIKDWSSTPSGARQGYIEMALDIPHLRGRIFFHAFDQITSKGRTAAKLDALERAINVFTPGNCHHAMFPEGIGGAKSRTEIRLALRKRGCENVTVDPCPFLTEPETRLSDALAGYIRCELYRGDVSRAPLTNLPSWFVELGT